MRYVFHAAVVLALSALAIGQAEAQINSTGLTVTNYQLLSEQRLSRTESQLTYRADLVNTGLPQPALTATVSSTVPGITVLKGQGNLHFAATNTNTRVTSSNTFTVLVDRSTDTDFSNLRWSYNAPVANAGPSRTVPIGATVTLDASGSTNPSGLGTLSYTWMFISRPPGTRVVLQNGTTLSPSFVPDVLGDYVLALIVDNGVETDTSTVTITAGQGGKPTANAGPNQSIKLGSTVTLNGAGSSDPSGLPLTYAWSLILRPSRSNATLSGSDTVSPTFVADQPGSYMAQLVVSDSNGSSDPSIVTITVQGNTPPVADAGPDQRTKVGTTVQLDGSKSTDVDGNPITYLWSLITVPAGSGAVLSNPTIVNPTFVPDVAGTYVAQLIVNDGTDNSLADTVTISTDSILAPTATVGSNQSLSHGSTVTLTGSGTDPQNLPLTFKWTLTSLPAGSNATLANPSSQNPTFIADRPGTYVAQLVVNNGTFDSPPATVQISSTNLPPVSNAGTNQAVAIGSTVTLDGGGTTDPENDPITYSWSLLSIPAGSKATLLSPNIVSPTFIADVAGAYVAQLIASDPYISGPPSTVTITVASNPLSLSPNPLNLMNVPGNLTVTIASAAGPGGQVVNLAVIDPSVATAPSSVTIPQGSTSAAVSVTPVSVGSTSILASAGGFQPAIASINVSAAGLSLSLSANSIGVTKTATGTITLSGPAPSTGLTVTLSTDQPGVATLPATVNIAAGGTTGTFTVTGASQGSVNITASAPGYPNPASALLTVSQLGVITVESNVTVAPGQSAPIGISLISPAPVGGVTINLTSSDTSRLTVSPTVFIAGGATTPATPAQVTGVNFGTATITASAGGFTNDTKSVQIAANLTFAPASTTIGAGSSGTLTLTLSGAAPSGGVTVNLTSSNSGFVTVPSSVTIPQGSSSVPVPVTGVAAGSANITAASAIPGIAGATATVNVVNGVVISTSALNPGVVGTAYNQTITATNGTGPYTFTATGLPAGLQLSSGGQLTGTPTAAGTSSVAITVTDSTSPTHLTNTATLPLVVSGPLSVTTASLPSGIVGSAYSFQVVTSGGNAPITFTATGLPAGLSISSGGLISGNPSANGTSNVTVTATDSTNPTHAVATATLQLTIGSQLTITTSTLPAGTQNTAYPATTVSASGGTGPYTFSATGLPAGLSISPGGVISGTPTAVGQSTATISVTDSTSPTPLTTTKQLPIVINPPVLAISTPSPLPAGTAGSPYSAQVTATGGVAPYSFTATGLPAGLTINSSGLISGTTNATGTTTVNVTVTDSAATPQTANAALSLTINPPQLTFNSVTLANGVVGTAYSASVGATGGTTPYSFTATGLPAGLSISSSGAITGTPTAAGTSNATVTVTDGASRTASGTVTITINQPPPPAITTSSLPNGTQGVFYSASVAATSGTPPYSFSATGLPPGLSISSGGVISGTPTVIGPYNITVTVTDAASRTASASFPVRIDPPVGCTGCIAVSSASIGQNLETTITVTLPSPAPSATVVTVSSDNSGLIVLAGRPGDVGQQTQNVQVPAGATTFGLIAQSLGSSGSATITASANGYTSGTGTINATPSGFVVSGPNGVGGSFNANQGTNTTLTVSAAQLDAGGNYVQTQQVRGGTTASVTVSNSGVGSVSPTTLNFTGGTDSLTTRYAAGQTSGTSQISVSVPPGFTAPAGNGNTVVASVQATQVLPQDVTVGQHLETTTHVSLQGVAPNDLTVTIVSNNPSQFLLSTDATSAGQTSITMTIQAGRSSTQDFYVYGVGNSGSATYTATVSGVGSGDGTVTLAPSGFVLESPFGLGADFFTTTGSAPTFLNVYSALLDSSHNYVASQAIAGGANVAVTVSSSNNGVGTINPSTVNFAPGTNVVSTNFQPVSNGSTTITAVTPATFTTPAQFGSLVATVKPPSILIGTGAGVVGMGLELQSSIFLGAPAPSGGLQVNLSSDNPSGVNFSASATGAGSPTLTITIPQGQSSAAFFIYGKTSSGTANVTAQAANYQSGSSSVSLAPSGVVIEPDNGPFFPINASKSAGTLPLNVSTAVLNQDNSYAMIQPLAGSTSVQVPVTSSNPSIGTVTSPVTITGGTSTAATTFTPVGAVGQTTVVSVSRPANPNFVTSTTDTQVTVRITN